MAQATLNPAIETLDTTSLLYELYTKFYDGMTIANNNDTPAFVTDPIYEKNEDGTYKLDEDGAKIVDTSAMAKKAKEYSAILIKNSAYMMANSILSTISPDSSSDSGSGGGSSTGLGYLSRNGDTMQGTLGALYGFEAGYANVKIFETFTGADNRNTAKVLGYLVVTQDAEIQGSLDLSNNGIRFGGNKVIWYDQSTLCLDSQDISLTGKVIVDGSINVGDVAITKNGITLGEYNFYHSGNANREDVDWKMRSALVDSGLQVGGSSTFSGKLSSFGGFTFSVDSNNLLYSQTQENAFPYVVLNSDLSVVNSHGIKFDDNYILWIREQGKIVSFAAPGAVMNLGDKATDTEGNDVATQYISLQTDIKSYEGSFVMVSHDGSGNFPNGFSAGAANALGAVLQTYTNGSNDYGVISLKNLRFGVVDGPSLSSSGLQLGAQMPYVYVSDGVSMRGVILASLGAKTSSSLIYNPTGNQSVMAIGFDTDASHFTFGAPIEASTFAIKSSKYKTQLDENVLFFSDGVFLEGVTGGMRLSGNSLFDNNLYSFNPSTAAISFSSGFAGSGWAILEDATAGGIHATFDCLTIRKKMRVYELEVQKISVTNGALWVSDSCSGDEVREIS